VLVVAAAAHSAAVAVLVAMVRADGGRSPELQKIRFNADVTVRNEIEQDLLS
jgi:hypothetical protein